MLKVDAFNSRKLRSIETKLLAEPAQPFREATLCVFDAGLKGGEESSQIRFDFGSRIVLAGGSQKKGKSVRFAV